MAPPLKQLQTILLDSAGYLGKHGSQSPRAEAEWLLTAALGLKRLDLYLQFDRPLSEPELAKIRPLLKRRAAGEPLQYILGTAPFLSRELLVGPGVLIPRPETERLVEIAAGLPRPEGPILDLCTGSGAILFGLAELFGKKAGSILPEMIGIDLSLEALVWARRNLEKYPVPTISFQQGDLFAPVAGRRFALITSNPPYVSEGEYAVLPRDVRQHEPALALASGSDGLDVFRRLLRAAPGHLLPGGQLICEIGEKQGDQVLALATQAGLQNPQILLDYTRRPRFLHATG